MKQQMIHQLMPQLTIWQKRAHTVIKVLQNRNQTTVLIEILKMANDEYMDILCVADNGVYWMMSGFIHTFVSRLASSH